MKKVAIAFLPLLLVLLSAFSYAPNTQEKHLQLYGCSGCYAFDQYYPINTIGTHTNTVVDNPNGTGFVDYLKEVKLYYSNGASVAVGIDKDYQYSGLNYFYNWGDGAGHSGYNHYSVPSGDINGTASFGADWESQGGVSALYIWINATATHDDPCNNNRLCFSSQSAFNPNNGHVIESDYYMLVDYNDIPNKHLVWGGFWTQNQYRTGSGWHNDGANGRVVGYSGLSDGPIQMYYPSYITDGSTLISCVYTTGSTCNIGS